MKSTPSLQLAGLLVVFLLVAGCGNVVRGSGDIVTETHEFDDASVDEYASIEVCCGFQVSLTEGEQASVTLTGDADVLEAIEVNDYIGTLAVQKDKWDAKLRPSQPVKLQVVLNDVRQIEAMGGVELEAGEIDTSALSVSFYGGGTADFDEIRADKLDITFEGGGEATLRGTADSQSVTLTGGVDYRAADLESTTADMTLRGGSEARVRVTDTLEVTASEGSRVRYSGQPTVEEHLRGGSEARPAEE